MLRVVCLVAGSLLVLHLLSADAPQRCCDERTALYSEDAPIPRPVAHVRARVLAGGDGLRLELAVSALGDGVDAVPGLEGVSGANLRTAEELDRLLRERGLQLVTRVDGRSEPGALLAVQHGRLPARRLRPDGHLELRAETEAEWPVCALFATAALPGGTSWSYLEADGVPRLAVQVANAGTTARIVAIESLAEPPARARSAVISSAVIGSGGRP
ncbi:MAG TPA: hypothetical protein VF384_14210 [Planctomycetota bacterium]